MAGPLEGLRVLELATDVAGPYAGKLLADHGADVLKVEPPAGDPARNAGPFFHDQPHVEGSGRFLFLNTNKRSVTLDLDADADREALLRLVSDRDVVVESFAPGWLGERGLGFEALEGARPGLVLASITPWGQSGGPYAGYRQSDLTAQAMGGPLLWTGSRNREPLKLGGADPLSHYHAGATAAVAIMMAVYRQGRTGAGEHIDVSILETQVASRDRVQPHLVAHSYHGLEPRRRADGITMGSGVRPCADGYVNVGGSGPRLPALLRMIGRDDLVGDPRLTGPAGLVPVDVAEEVESSYLAWLMARGKREVVEAAQAHGLLACGINTPADLLADPHYRERGTWETVDHPHTGPVEYPGRPFVLSKSPRPPAKRAPLLGEHTASVLAALGERPAAKTRSTAGAGPAGRTGASAAPGLPLQGVRILDVTVAWAGPACTSLLAEWGAEVIRVEPITHIQPTTRFAERRATREQMRQIAEQGQFGGGNFPECDPGADPWNRNSSFNSNARNKLSCTADVTTEAGREVFYRLAAVSDMVVENNVPVTIEKTGLTYERLCEVNPRIIVLRMPAFGLSGPYAGYRGMGTHIEGMIGHHYLRGYPDGTPEESGEVFTADGFSAVQAAFAAIVALQHRERTGEGQQVELAQAENFLAALGETILDWTMNRRDAGPQGNQHRSHAPHQVYPCRGDDEWIAIDVGSDHEFAALCGALDADALTADARFATAPGRWRHRTELDPLIAERTREWDKFELFHALQRAGVVAGPVQTAAEKRACPQLQARGFFEYLDQESVGPQWYPGLAWKFERTPNRLRRGPVRLGQDNDYVYRELLGVSDEEYHRLVESGQVGTAYVPSLLGVTA